MARQSKNPPGCMVLLILLVGLVVFVNIAAVALQSSYVALVFVTVIFGVFFIILLQVVIQTTRQNSAQNNKADRPASLAEGVAAGQTETPVTAAKKSIAGYIIGFVVIAFIFFNGISHILTRGFNEGSTVFVTVFIVFFVFWLRGLMVTLAHNRRLAEKVDMPDAELGNPEVAGADFMANRRVPRRGEGLDPWRRPSATPASAGDGEQMTATAAETTMATGQRFSQSGINDFEINGILWRWCKGFTRPYIVGAFCSKCGNELNHVENAESWQADFKCPNCGKSYISIAKQEANAKPRSLAKTKHIISAVIREKLR